MKDIFESEMNQIIQDEARSAEALQKAYPLIKNLCERVSSNLRAVISEIPVPDPENLPSYALKLRDLIAGVENEPVNMLLKISEIQGFLKGAQTGVDKLNNALEAAQRSDERIERVAEKIQAGDLDPDQRRKVGERPESLKSLRQAKEKIKENEDT